MMPKAKTRKPVEDEIVVGPLPLDPVVDKGPEDNGYVLDMGGKGAEVASALVVNGIVPYLAVTNKGINLVAANRAATAFVPVKITSRTDWPTLDLKKDDAGKLEEAGAILAFLVGDDDDRWSWFLTVAEFLSKAEPRGEGTLSIRIADHEAWLEKFEGHAGIRRAFKGLLK
jgi:hypothetical protein